MAFLPVSCITIEEHYNLLIAACRSDVFVVENVHKNSWIFILTQKMYSQNHKFSFCLTTAEIKRRWPLILLYGK